RSERGRIHMQLARWLERRRDAEPQTVAGHYASAVSLGTAEARPDAVRMLLRAASEARKVYAHGLALRQAGLAQSLANGERDRALAAEAVGDAYWMAEQLDDALDAYGQALEHGHRAGLGEHDMARLSWKWVDLPTRWGGLHLRAAPTREAIEAEIEDGLRNALSADASVLQARLEVANQALVIAERLERSGPLVISAALDARATLLVALRRYDDASEAFERRMSLIRSIAFREEQMDICAAT